MAAGGQRSGFKINRYGGKRHARAENEAFDSKSESKPKVSGEKAREKVFSYALKLLAAKPRSENQLRDKLAAKAWVEPELIDECLARLKEMGYINDRVFAMNYATSRLSLKSIGRARLARELAEKQLSREIVEETLAAVFEEGAEEDLLDRAIAKQIRLRGRPQDEKAVRRLFAYLMRRGFSYNAIAGKVRAFLSDG